MSRCRVVAFALGVLCALASLACFGPILTDPREAGFAYAAQGEYASSGRAAQVIALGEGRFEAALYSDRLPGMGNTSNPPIRLAGVERDGQVVFEGGIRATLRDGLLSGRTPEGADFALAKVDRQSPTLGASAPANATVLFDGTDGTDGPGGFDGDVDDDGNLEAGAVTRDAYQSFELHLEFRTPFMPSYRGQRRGNSGVYLQNRYEIQVLDSFGLDPALDGCGALYAQKAPVPNMSLPPLRWQTYDIVFQAARFDGEGRRVAPAVVSLRHNGVLVHDRVALQGPMDGGDEEGPAPGPILLQDLWMPVAYRNVWIVER